VYDSLTLSLCPGRSFSELCRSSSIRQVLRSSNAWLSTWERWGRGNKARHALDAALNAELLLDIFHTVEHVLKFLPVYHFIAQGVDVGLDSSHARVKIV
jgi:hypothetical protein